MTVSTIGECINGLHMEQTRTMTFSYFLFSERLRDLEFQIMFISVHHSASLPPVTGLTVLGRRQVARRVRK